MTRKDKSIHSLMKIEFLWQKIERIAGMIGYMDLVDFYDELPSQVVIIYPTLEQLKKSKDCLNHCGIVKVRVNDHCYDVKDQKPIFMQQQTYDNFSKGKPATVFPIKPGKRSKQIKIDLVKVIHSGLQTIYS